jgi:hypothetical protein
MKVFSKILILCTIAPLCWGAQEATLLDQFKSAVNSGGKMLYETGKGTVPVILVDPVEREAQLKEIRTMTRPEMALPVATGIASGVAYAFCAAHLGAAYDGGDGGRLAYTVARTIAAGIGIPMAKKMLFGYLHPKEKKRDAVDSIDTMITALTFVAAAR